MATIKFFSDSFHVQPINDSGLGFYGAGFGESVDVAAYQQTTFITNANGTVQGPQVNNVKYVNSFSGVVGSATSGIRLTQIPNYLATMNIRFEHDTTVQVQNAKFYVFDRVSQNNNPSGVLCQVAELIHPDIVQSNVGSGDTTWTSVFGSGSILTLSNSPGISGLYAANGSSSTRPDTRHDFYLAVSSSPSSIGSKLFAGRVTLEYL
jgi:hypothetical protein